MEYHYKQLESQLFTFDRRPGAAGAGGQFYERELVMILLLQGIAKKETKELEKFYLATNINKLGCFDDVVLKYKYIDQSCVERTKVIFLQAKHKDNPVKEKAYITINRLITEPVKKGKKNDFYLGDYFNSYLKIKDQFSKENDTHLLFGGAFEDCDFILYTNAAYIHQDVNVNDQNLKIVDNDQTHILNTNGIGYHYELVLRGEVDINQKIIDVLLQSSDHTKLAKELVKSLFPSTGQNKKQINAELVNQGIIKDYQVAIAETVVVQTTKGKGLLNKFFLDGDGNLSPCERQFRETFFNEVRKKAEFSNKSLDDIKDMLQDIIIKLPSDFGIFKEDKVEKGLPPYISESDIILFLSQLKLFVGQPNHSELSKIIKTKLQGKYKDTTKSDIETIYSKVNKRIESWWEKKNYYLTDKHNYFGEEKLYLEKLQRPPLDNLPEIWRVPSQNTHFVGRKTQISKINECLSGSRIVTLAALHGLGGIGKTQLALHYAWEYSKQYKAIIWFDATDRVTFENDYIKMGVELNLLHDSDGKIENEDRAKHVKNWLEDPKRAGWLLIGDNAPNYMDIADLLPSKGGHILLTSRYEFGWPQHQNTLLVNVFDPAESRKFICKILEVENVSLIINQVDELASLLGHLPLALAQACAYIKKTCITISNYLKLYNNKKHSLLNNRTLLETFPAGSNRENAANVYVTWDITLEEIRKESFLATHWLTACAYLGSRPIPLSLMETFADNPANNPSSEMVHEAVSVLKSYSMITFQAESRIMLVHNLVQEVMRIKDEKNDEAEDKLKMVVELIKSDMEINPHSDVDCAQSAWNYSKRYLTLVKEYHQIPVRIITRLNEGIMYKEAISFGRNAVEDIKSVIVDGPLSLDIFLAILELKFCLAVILNSYGKYDESYQTYKEIIKEIEKIADFPNIFCVVVMNNMGIVLTNIGKFEEALGIYKELIDKMKQPPFSSNSYILNIQKRMGEVLQEMGKYDEALKEYTYVLAEFEKTYGVDAVTTLSVRNNIVEVFMLKGQYKDALAACKEILECLDKLECMTQNHPILSRSKHNMALILLELGKYSEALEICKENLQTVEDVLHEHHPDVLSEVNIMATIHLNQGNFPQALQYFNKVLEGRIKELGPNHPDTLFSELNIANVLDRQGQTENALNIFENVFEVMKRKEILGPCHPHTLKAQYGIAEFYIELCMFDKAQLILKDVLEKRTQVLGASHPETYKTKITMCALQLKAFGECDNGLRNCITLFEDQTRVLGSSHPYTLETKSLMADFLKTQGKFGEALQSYQYVLDFQSRLENLGPNHRLTLSTKSSIAFVLERQNKYDESLSIYQDIFNKQIADLGPLSPDTLQTNKFIASVLEKQGKYKEALQTYKHVIELQEKWPISGSEVKILETKVDMAWLLCKLGQYDEALNIYTEVIDKEEIECNSTYANLKTKAFRSLESLMENGILKRVISIRSDSLGVHHPDTIAVEVLLGRVFSFADNRNDELRNILNDIDFDLNLSDKEDTALALAAEEKYDEALTILNEVFDIRTAMKGPDDVDTLIVELHIAEILGYTDKYGEGLEIINALSQTFTKMFGAGHISILETITVKQKIGLLLADKCKFGEALTILSEVVDARTAILGPDNPDTQCTKKHIAEIISKKKQSEKGASAGEYYERQEDKPKDGLEQVDVSVPKYIFKQGVPYLYVPRGRCRRELEDKRNLKRNCIVM